MLIVAQIAYPLNYLGGWGLVLLGFLSGAALGLRFHRDDFLGGYASFRRRILRLGHIACVALGMLNILMSATMPSGARWAALLLMLGGVFMPSVCFLTAWNDRFKALFFVPVLCLVGGVVAILIRGAT